MSHDFIQFSFPCSECIVRAACKDIPKNAELKKLYDKMTPRCLTVPEVGPSEMSYTKMLIECWANLGHEIICRMRKSENPHTCMETNNKIPMQYIMLIGQMAGLLQWITNSTSWDLGELQDFDAVEVRNKCKHITL